MKATLRVPGRQIQLLPQVSCCLNLQVATDQIVRHVVGYAAG